MHDKKHQPDENSVDSGDGNPVRGTQESGKDPVLYFLVKHPSLPLRLILCSQSIQHHQINK